MKIKVFFVLTALAGLSACSMDYQESNTKHTYNMHKKESHSTVKQAVKKEQPKAAAVNGDVAPRPDYATPRDQRPTANTATPAAATTSSSAAPSLDLTTPSSNTTSQPVN